MATIFSGGTCLLEPVFDAKTVVADMERFGVTHVVAADDVVGRLAEAWQVAPVALERWRRLLLADFNGHSQELASWAEEQFGLIASGVYGSSEVFALAAFWPVTTPSPQRWQGGGATVSQDVQVRCVDPQTGDPLALGQTGELEFRGPNVVDDYLGAPALRSQNVSAEGWFRSGDLGAMLGDRTFSYRCRAGDALRLKGFLVEPAEIEARLAAHPAVAMNKVVGLRMPDGATEAVGFVVLNPGSTVSGAQLRDWCAQSLARHKVPRAIHMVDAMPVTSGVNGTKIKAGELRQWAQDLESQSLASIKPKESK
jgi:fatty-acyl-CoA synthase